jgi:hypothetical protein
MFRHVNVYTYVLSGALTFASMLPNSSSGLVFWSPLPSHVSYMVGNAFEAVARFQRSFCYIIGSCEEKSTCIATLYSIFKYRILLFGTYRI